MLFKSVEVVNFRQFIHEKIEFNVDEEHNIIIIIGNNGVGKTTLVQAIRWCLFGNVMLSETVLLNMEQQEKLTEGQTSEEVRVTLVLEHADREYTVTRSVRYKKRQDGSITRVDSPDFRVVVKEADGVSRAIGEEQAKLQMKNILPEQLSSFFMFDGEFLERLSQDIVKKKTCKDFKEGAVRLIGLAAMERSIHFLNPGNPSSVIAKIRKEFEDIGDDELRKKQEELAKLCEGIEDQRKRITDIESSISKYKKFIEEDENKLREYEEGIKALESIKKIEEDCKRYNENKCRARNTLFELFSNNYQQYILMSLSYKALQMIEDIDFMKLNLPELDARTINRLLEDGKCICGTSLVKGTTCYEHLKKLAEFLPPNFIGATASNFVGYTQGIFDSKIDEFARFENFYTEFDNACDDWENAEEEKNKIIDRCATSSDIESEVKSLNQSILGYQALIDEEIRKKEAINIRIHKLEGERDYIDKLIRERAADIEKGQSLQNEIDLATLIFNQLENKYQNRENHMRDRLEKMINEIFQKMDQSQLRLQVNSDYSVDVYSAVTNFKIEISTAQSMTVTFSFILAISQLVRELYATEKDEEVCVEPCPLVMDAPLSTFDGTRIQAICNELLNVREQVIIMIKDVDGELARKHLGSKIKSTMYLRKYDEFDTRVHKEERA